MSQATIGRLGLRMFPRILIGRDPDEMVFRPGSTAPEGFVSGDWIIDVSSTISQNATIEIIEG